ncbi:MAG: polymer-forming cytoskeletal protein [Polyangiaceae bacterium]
MTTTASTIGRGTIIRGTIRGEGDLEIEGRVEGMVAVDGEVTVADSGRVRIEEGELSGQRILVRGAVAGNLRASSTITLEEGARVQGDLSAPTIGIRPGGLLRGYVSTGDGASAPAPARAAEVRRPAAEESRAPEARRAPAVVPTSRAAAAPSPPPRTAPTTQRATPSRTPAPAVTRPAARAAARPTPPAAPEPPPAPAPEPPAEAGAPAPVMPSLKKGQKGQLRRRNGK